MKAVTMPVGTLGRGPCLSWGVRRGFLECVIFPEEWKGIRKGLVSQARELGLYAECSREPWRGFKEGRDTPAPAQHQAQPASPAMGDVHGGMSQGYSWRSQEDHVTAQGDRGVRSQALGQWRAGSSPPSQKRTVLF